MPDVVDHDVHSGLRRRLTNDCGDVVARAVQRVIRAQRLRALEFLVAPRRHPHFRAECFADLQRLDRDPSSDSPNEHSLAGLNASLRVHHAPRSECREGEGRGHLCVSLLRDVAHVCRGHGDVFGCRSGLVLAENLVPQAERVLPDLTVCAGAVADARVDHNKLADRNARDLTTDGVNDATRIRADDPRWNHRHSRQPAEREQVEMVERGGANPNANVGCSS